MEKEKFESMIYGNVSRFLYVKKDIKQKSGTVIDEIKTVIQKKDLTLYDWEQIIEKSKQLDTSAQNTKKELLSIYEELKKIGFLIASKCKSHSESITDILARYYMQQIGTLEIILTAEKHYNRMNLSLQHIRHLPQNPETAKKWGYVELPKSQSVYHGENNRKFVHPTGSEVIYDRQGRIVVDPRYIGTWNYGTEPASISHIISDMIPYWIWGNTEDDPTGLFKRIFGMDLDELINFYEKKNKNEQ